VKAEAIAFLVLHGTKFTITAGTKRRKVRVQKRDPFGRPNENDFGATKHASTTTGK